ncbi:MAG: helix-turn-helix domain-containing protein [Syntrophales bacterium]|jgi:excisionase family DNA binding protein|nr:helix-turn-helix domain-containing protein [Syntrophales bacterium]
MEKICIAKLRKKLCRTVENRTDLNGNGNGVRLMNIASFEERVPAGREEALKRVALREEGVSEDFNIALSLTREQTDAFQSNRRILEILNAGETIEGKGPDGKPFILKLQFETSSPLKMLKAAEVIKMLNISKSFLDSLVKKGELKSFKIGRLRRFMCSDILTYIEKNRDVVIKTDSGLKSN